jgi:hypothetical protein
VLADSEAVRVTVEAVRVLLKAMRVIIEAVRKIIEAMRLFVEAVRVLGEAVRGLRSSANKSFPIDSRLRNNFLRLYFRLIILVISSILQSILILVFASLRSYHVLE